MYAVPLAAGPETAEVWSLLALFSIPALVLLNGFFVAAEFSLVAVPRTRIEELLSRRVKGARAVLTAMDGLDRSIATTQLGITAASIGLTSVGEPAIAGHIEPLFS